MNDLVVAMKNYFTSFRLSVLFAVTLSFSLPFILYGIAYVINNCTVDYNNFMSFGGLFLSFVGSFVSGPYANGLPKKGDPIKAPKQGGIVYGWGLITAGLFTSAIGTLNLIK